MKLSVIVPCFNAAEFIAVQLESLANQDWDEPWEILVSDNGSTDESLAIVEKYRTRLPNLRVVDSSDKRGAAHARNVAALSASGDALAFCDADDKVGSMWVAAMGKALSEYDFVAGRLESDKLNSASVVAGHSVPQTDGLQEYNYPHFLPHAASCNLGIKRSVHQTVGGFDESMFQLEDTDYCWRIQLKGIKLHFVQDAVIHYRLRPTLGGSIKQARLWGKYNVLLYKRYRPLGMPKLQWYTGLERWVRLLLRLPVILWKEKRRKWIRRFAWLLGRLQGCVKYRVLAL